MIGYCKRCRLHTFITFDKICNACFGSYYQDNKNYNETNKDPNIELRQSSSILRDIDQAGNDW